MKKLMTLMLGLSLALGSVAVSFAQDTTKKATRRRKAPKKKKGDTTKKASLALCVRKSPDCRNRQSGNIPAYLRSLPPS